MKLVYLMLMVYFMRVQMVHTNLVLKYTQAAVFTSIKHLEGMATLTIITLILHMVWK